MVGRTFEKGTEVGFNKEEIKKTPTDDLLALRKSVLLYLKSKKLKKRNANFMEVYQRINEELKERKSQTKKEEESKNLGFVKVIQSQWTSGSNSETNSETDQESRAFLKRKHSMNIQVEIPAFLNDKKQKNDSIAKKEEEKPSDKACVNGIFYLSRFR